MRVSAHSILKGGKGIQPQPRPDPNSILGAVYDALMRGELVRLSDFGVSPNSKGRIIEQLKDYGLELRRENDPLTPRLNQRGGNRPRALYKCLGVWDNDSLRTLEDVREALENSVLRDHTEKVDILYKKDDPESKV